MRRDLLVALSRDLPVVPVITEAAPATPIAVLSQFEALNAVEYAAGHNTVLRQQVA